MFNQIKKMTDKNIADKVFELLKEREELFLTEQREYKSQEKDEQYKIKEKNYFLENKEISPYNNSNQKARRFNLYDTMVGIQIGAPLGVLLGVAVIGFYEEFNITPPSSNFHEIILDVAAATVAGIAIYLKHRTVD